MWINAHKYIQLVNRSTKARCYVKFQKKSGDASTFVGNTFFLMSVISVLFDLNDIDLSVFGGNDSLLVGGNINYNLNSACASLFGIKIFKTI